MATLSQENIPKLINSDCKHIKDIITSMASNNVPINVKPAGGGGDGQGMGWGFDIFQKVVVKFPAHGQIIPVNCNQISPPRAAHLCRSQAWTQERHNKNISK